MSAVTQLNVAALADRAKNILLQPASEWDKVAGEAPSMQDLFLRYVAILAGIPALSGFVGDLASNYGMRNAFRILILYYVMSFVGAGIAGFAGDYLAPHFGGKRDRISAFKLVVYSMTAFWLAGLVDLIPAFRSLVVVGFFYSIYLFYLGVPKLMKIPAENVGTYTAAVTIVSMIAGGLAAEFMMMT